MDYKVDVGSLVKKCFGSTQYGFCILETHP